MGPEGQPPQRPAAPVPRALSLAPGVCHRHTTVSPENAWLFQRLAVWGRRPWDLSWSCWAGCASGPEVDLPVHSRGSPHLSHTSRCSLSRHLAVPLGWCWGHEMCQDIVLHVGLRAERSGPDKPCRRCARQGPPEGAGKGRGWKCRVAGGDSRQELCTIPAASL